MALILNDGRRVYARMGCGNLDRKFKFIDDETPVTFDLYVEAAPKEPTLKSFSKGELLNIYDTFTNALAVNERTEYVNVNFNGYNTIFIFQIMTLKNNFLSKPALWFIDELKKL